MKKTVTIFSVWSKREAWQDCPHYDVFVDPQPAPDMLEQAFAMTNIDTRPLRHDVNSTTSGDMMLLEGQHYLVENDGFHLLTPAEAEAVKALTSRDTSFGYNDLKKNNLI